MRKLKDILTDKKIKKEAVKKLPSLKTVDFRTPKKIDEKVHGDSDFYGLDDSRYKAREKTHNELMHHHEVKHGTAISADIHGYTLDSEQLNIDLHHGKREVWHEKMIKHLDEHTSSHPAHKDFHVYSGLWKKPEIGEHHHPAYMSTSLHPHVARNFAIKHKDGESHILKIRIPQGSKHGAYIAGHSDQPNEREFLLGRGKKLHIHPEPEKVGKTQIWHAHIVD